MGKIILRVGPGVELTPDLLDRMTKLFGCEAHEIEIEHYKHQDDLQMQDSFIRRKASLDAAFRFAMEAIPPSCPKADLEKYLAWCNEQTPMPAANPDVNVYEGILGHYLRHLCNGVADFYPATGGKKDVIIGFLNRAEQYDIMRKGRPDLATLSVSSNDPGKLTLRWDKQLPACSEQTLAELDSIKKSPMSTTPNWFSFPSGQKFYLHGSDSAVELSDDLYLVQTAWTNAKGGAGIADELTAIKNDKNVPAWYSALPPGAQAMIRESTIEHGSNVQKIDSVFKKADKLIRDFEAQRLTELQHLRQLPYWFTALPVFDQRFLKSALAGVRDVAEAVFFIPSRLRIIAGAMSNFRENRSFLYTADGELIEDFGSQLSSSHVASRDVKAQSPQLMELYTDRNIQRLVDEAKKAGKKALHIQTLVSPLRYPPGVVPDYQLNEERIRAINKIADEAGIEIYWSNHPYNVYKYWAYTQPDSKNCLAFLDRARRMLLPESVRERLQGLPVEKADMDLLCALTSDCLNFIDQWPDHQAFGLLFQLAKILPPTGGSPDQYLDLIQAARSNASSSQDSVSPALQAFFAANREKLQAVAGWERVLANLWYLSGHHDKSTPDVLAKVSDITNLAQIARDYFNLLNSPRGTATLLDHHAREMTLSAQEGLLAKYMGDVLIYGSCISGKDRKELQLIMVLAMNIYYDTYGQWPNYFDKGDIRARFVDIVAELYITRHGAVHSGQNAPGADGIKHPFNYFPGDISKAIGKKIGRNALRDHDRLASNNELKDIPFPGQIESNRARCTIAALKLNEEQRRALLSEIKIIAHEDKYWATKVSTSNVVLGLFFTPREYVGPAAVKSFKAIFANTESSSTEALADVYMALLARKVDPNRAAETTDFYNCLSPLITSPDPAKLMETSLTGLCEVKNRIFAATQQTRRSASPAMSSSS